jgi:hypothetical protein
MADTAAVRRAKILLDGLSQTPRFAGSSEEAEARTQCREELERAGFTCRDLPFEYSQWPGRWGPPIAAVIQTATVLVVAHMAVHHGPLWALIIGAGLVSALMLTSADAKRRWTAVLPWQRATSVNLEARRGSPEVWLVAHIDSKSQTVPMLLRIASSVVVGVITALALLIILLSFLGARTPLSAWHVLAIAAVLGALPSIFCFVRSESRGALDNATGVAAVLIASEAAATPRNLGVLITSGEELGLAGARAWAAGASSEIVVVNCDTLDDTGSWRCMYSGVKPARITRAAETIALKLGFNVAIGRMIPGILADSMAFADRGIESVTISRGNLSTLARIHTRRDTSTALGGSGVADGAALLSSLAKELA